jgi:glycosyltransferase involved in cell wall biosynthesis
MEALKHGLPIICLDHNGAGDVVNEECGIKIPLKKPQEVISQLAEAITLCYDDRNKLSLLSNNAMNKAKKYLWSYRAQELAKYYQSIMEASLRKKRL